MFVAVSAENAIFVTKELDFVLDCTMEIDVNKNLAVGSNARDYATCYFIYLRSSRSDCFTSADHSGAEVDGIAT